MNRFLVSFIFALICVPSFSQDNTCDLAPDSMTARKFMLNNGLIMPGEESDLIVGKLEWGIQEKQSASTGNACLLVMSLCYISNETGLKDCSASDSLDVIVYQDNQLKLFERSFSIPRKVQVKFIADKVAQYQYDHYYAEVSEPSSVLNLKKAQAANLTRQRKPNGMRGIVVKGDKFSFDPTPDRNWRIIQTTFSLRESQSIEVQDVYPHDFDQDLEGMFRGCDSVTVDGQTGCVAKPWNASFNEFISEEH